MFRILATAVALIGVVAAAHADVYRWTDAQGHVQYSDRWVPGSTLIKGSSHSPGPPQQSDQQKLAASNANAADEKAKRDAEQTVKQDVAASRAEQCKKVSAEYEKAIASRRIYKAGKSGDREYLSDADADAYRAQLLTQRKDVCGK
jgi:hypothetical protein